MRQVNIEFYLRPPVGLFEQGQGEAHCVRLFGDRQIYVIEVPFDAVGVSRVGISARAEVHHDAILAGRICYADSAPVFERGIGIDHEAESWISVFGDFSCFTANTASAAGEELWRIGGCAECDVFVGIHPYVFFEEVLFQVGGCCIVYKFATAVPDKVFIGNLGGDGFRLDAANGECVAFVVIDI